MNNTTDMPILKNTENQAETEKIKAINKAQFEYMRDNWFLQPDKISKLIDETTVMIENDEVESLKQTLNKRFDGIKKEFPIMPYSIYLMYSFTTKYTYNYVQRILAEKRRA